MAKGSFLGVKRGKLGDAVGFNVTNSNDKDKQGWRVYQPVVSNPQTDGQIDQRIKLAAANNLYRALKPIIQRGWENHKYGDASRRAFLKRALGASFTGPYLEKGSTLAVPIEGVPITYGSLTPVTVECGNGFTLLTNVPFPDGIAGTTIGDLSSLFVDANLAQQGDQVTFILASLNSAGTVSYLTRSFYVDPGSADNVVDVLGFEISSENYDGGLVVGIDMGVAGLNTDYFAAMVSVSRDGETSNLRSYAEFDMTTEFRTYFYGSASQIAAAKRSYRRTQSADTNWPLVPDGGGGSSTSVVAVTKSGVELTPRQLINVEAEPARLVSTDGERYYLIAHTDATDKWLYGQGTDGWTSSSSAPSGSTNANTIDPCAAANIAGGFRDWLIAQGVPASLLVIA